MQNNNTGGKKKQKKTSAGKHQYKISVTPVALNLLIIVYGEKKGKIICKRHNIY